MALLYDLGGTVIRVKQINPKVRPPKKLMIQDLTPISSLRGGPVRLIWE